MTEANLSAKVTADIADFNKKFGEMHRTLDKLGADVSGGVGGASKALGQMEKHLGGIGKVLSSGVLVELGKGLTAAVMEPLIGIGKEAVFMADKMNQAKNAFTTMLGSADKAAQFLQTLQDIAVKTPFEFTQLQDASKRLLAMGIAADKIPTMILNIGDAVSGLGSGTQGFDRITTALGQMNAKGRATAEEMKQFTEAGIGAWDALAKHLNVSVAQAMEMVTKRQVDSATAITAIMAGMGERFGGLMAQQSATIEGQLSNLKDTSAMILTGLGQELITVLRLPDVIAAVGGFAREFLGWFTALDAGTKQIILVVAGAFAASGPILVAVGAFMAAMAVVTAPMLAGGAIVAGIIAGVGLIILNWQKIKDTGTALWTGLTNTVTSVVDRMVAGIDAAIAKLGAILDGVREKTDAVKEYFRSLYDAVVGHSYIPDMVDEIGRHMQNLDVAMTAPARNATVATAKIFEGLAFTTQDAMNQVVSTINFAWGSATQGVSQALAQMTSAQVNWAQVGIQIGQQFLAAMINQIISLMTQWALAAVFGQKAHTAMETAKTAATVAGNAARLGTTVATNKAMLASVTSTIVGFGAVGNAAMAVMAAALEGVVAFMMAVAASVSYVPIVGQALAGTIIVGATKAQIVGAAAIIAATAALNVALGGATVAATTALATPLASGGIVTGPTFALIGEAGPEAVIPLSRAGGFGDRRPTHVHVHLNGREIALAVADDLPGALRTMGVPA